MPIGFDSGGFGGSGGGGSTAWPSGDPVTDLRPLLNPWIDPEPVETGIWTWAEVDASIVYPVTFEVWATADDERTCPECAPLDGEVWEAGSGIYPTLHPNCRCRRLYHHTEWQTRYATAWELRWVAF